jgi:hypothetical protein
LNFDQNGQLFPIKKVMQTLKESPFWSDAEQGNVQSGYSLDAFPRLPTIKANE